jgi:hypothetical protein
MLLDKLEEANRATQRRRLLLAAGFFGVVVFLGLFLLAVFVLQTDNDAATPDESVLRADNSPVARTPDGAAKPAAKEDDVTRLRPDRPAASATPPARVEDAAANAAARDQFKVAIQAFQKVVEPGLTESAFAAWNADAQTMLLAGRDEAFEFFSRGQYAEALTRLETVSDQARQELAARDAAFETALAAAQNFYDADDHEQAADRIARARQLNSTSEDARDLEARVARLPEVLTAIGKAAVARIENDLEAEDRHLSTALSLDPARTELAERQTQIRTQLQESRFAAQIESGFSNVLSRKLGAARTNLKNARAIYSGRSEVGLLSRKIDALDQQLKFETLMAKAGSARAADDWVAAEDFYAQAGALVADDPKVVGDFQLAGEVNRLRTELERILDAPERLSSVAVADNAKGLVSKAGDVAELSPSLADASRKVARLIDEYGRKVSIRILSDGVTRISVQGVGQVGVTTDRTIQLRPGSYVFEGARAGFRSKLIPVDILPGTEGLVVEIYPNEPV